MISVELLHAYGESEHLRPSKNGIAAALEVLEIYSDQEMQVCLLVDDYSPFKSTMVVSDYVRLLNDLNITYSFWSSESTLVQYVGPFLEMIVDGKEEMKEREYFAKR